MKEMNNSKKAYLAPMVETMVARVEKGFQGSGGQTINSNTENLVNGNTLGSTGIRLGDGDFD